MSKLTQKTDATRVPEAHLSSSSSGRDQAPPHITLCREWATATPSEAELETRLQSRLSEAATSNGMGPMERWEKETQQESPWNNIGAFKK